MARLVKILSELDTLGIPDGVRMIIAGYAELTEEERIRYMMEISDGRVTFSDEIGHSLTIRYSGNVCQLEIYNSYEYPQRIHNRSFHHLAYMLREQFWLSQEWKFLLTSTPFAFKKGSRLTPLWQKIYDLWVAL